MHCCNDAETEQEQPWLYLGSTWSLAMQGSAAHFKVCLVIFTMNVLQKHHRCCCKRILDDTQWRLELSSFCVVSQGSQVTLQVELAAQAAEKQQAVSELQEQVARLQDQVARAQVASSPVQVHTRLHTCVYKADKCL